MFRNYLIVAIRNLYRHKAFSLINVTGLAVGMACCVLIFLYVDHELSYDRHHEKAGQIYRIIREFPQSESGSFFHGGASGALTATLPKDLPVVEQAVRLFNWPGVWVRHGDREFGQTLCVADPAILEVFTLPLVRGDRSDALRDHSSILITEEMALKLYPGAEPLGQLIFVDGYLCSGEYRVSGVLADFPENTTLRFDLLTSTVSADMAAQYWDTWQPRPGWLPLGAYVEIAAGHPAEEVEDKLTGLVSRRVSDDPATRPIHHLQPLPHAHLYTRPDYGWDWFPGGDVHQIRRFSLIAVAVLLLASINYVSLTTARSVSRAREIGLRQTAGAHRSQLIGQLLGESTLMALSALLLGLALAGAALPHFNAFTGTELAMRPTGRMLLLLAGLTVFVGIGAGSIPAAVLSALRPAQVLKGAIMRAGRGRLRRAMVVVQFALYILLMATTFTVNQQLEYLSGKNLGFNREQLVVLPLFSTDWSLLNRYETIEAEFLRHPDITSVSSSWATTAASGKLHDVRAQGEGAPRRMRLMRVDADFLDTYQIELVAGRNFSRDIQSDLTSAFLLNETAVEQLGWADPIGKQFEWMAGSREGTVIGVVGDFHFQPLRDRIQPLFMAHSAGIRS